MQKWTVDIPRLIDIVAVNIYTDPIKAGIRELIQNSLDARLDKVEIWIDYDDIHKKLRYSDTGIGIDPESFKEIYGKIASGHKRRKGSRGFFGIGRMSLIVASEKGMILSYKDGKIYTWKFNRKGWSGPEIVPDLDQIGHGVYVEFEGITLEDLGEIERWIRRTFTLPLLRKECMVFFQDNELFTLIEEKWIEENPIETKDGSIRIYSKEETDGTLCICHKGILVKEEPYTGLSVFVDQSFLDIKTDREGFVNNSKYRQFNLILKKELAEIRPTKSFEKMEVDFIQRLMKEFKKYWFKKVKKINHVLEKIEIEFPETGKEIVTEEPILQEKEEEMEAIPLIDQPGFEEAKKELEMWDRVPDELPPEGIPVDSPKTVEMEEKLSVSWNGDKPLEAPKVEEKVVKIKGAKPVDLGEDYPMIFFETEPFVLVFNTSHPLFRKLVEERKLGSKELGILFERMMEAAYCNENPSEDLEQVKARWKTVDKKLVPLFEGKTAKAKQNQDGVPQNGN